MSKQKYFILLLLALLSCISFMGCQIANNQGMKGKRIKNNNPEIEYLIYGLGDPMYNKVLIVDHIGRNMAFERLLKQSKKLFIPLLIEALHDDRELTGAHTTTVILLHKTSLVPVPYPNKPRRKEKILRVSDAIEYILKDILEYRATAGLDFNSDYIKEEREKCIKKWQDWWIENKNYIYWNEKSERFKIDKEAKKAGVPTKEYRKTHPWPEENKPE